MSLKKKTEIQNISLVWIKLIFKNTRFYSQVEITHIYTVKIIREIYEVWKERV